MNKTLFRLCRFLDREVSVKTFLREGFYCVQLRLMTPFYRQDCKSIAKWKASKDRSKKA